MRFLRRLFVLPIRLYQRLLSPLFPPSCRFEPSCSEYGAQAILAHGVVKGLLLSIWRILRCQPFARGGHDPVPAPGHWRPATCADADAHAGTHATKHDGSPPRGPS